MSRKIKNIFISAFALFLFLCITLTFAFFNVDNTKIVFAKDVFADINVQDNYLLNDKIELDSEISFQYGEEIVTANNGVLVYPDGNAVLVARQNQMQLNQMGKYVLKYFHNSIDFGSLVVKEEFYVSDALYGLTANNGSSIVAATKESMSEISGTCFESNDVNKTLTGEDGLIVRLNSGCKFVYSQPIDLTNAGEDGLTEIIRLDPRIHHKEERTDVSKDLSEPIARKLVVTLTDCYDPNIYVRIYIESISYWCYLRAGTNDLVDVGISMPSDRYNVNGVNVPVYYDGVRGLAWYSQYGGGAAGFRFDANYHNGITLKIDYENARLYSSSTQKGTTNTSFFADFLNETVYGDSKYTRFTTGEVYLSLEYAEYDKSGSARVDVYSIAENDGSYLTDDEKALYNDHKAPVLNVDFTPTEYDGVYVAVGEDFEIPSASAYDINLQDISVNVYRGNGNNKIDVAVRDNKFTVNCEDVFYVQYTAIDKTGNETEKIIKVRGVKFSDETVSLKIGDIKDSIEIGQEYTLPTPEISTINNKKDLKLKIEVKSNNQNLVLADLTGEENIRAFFNQEGSLKFVPLYVGDYQIVYKYGDNAVNNFDNPLSVKADCKSSDNVCFLDKPFIQRYLLKDASYALDMVNAYSFVNGKPEIIDGTKAYVSFDGEDFVEIEDLNSVKISANSTARIKFVNGTAEALSDVATVIDVNYAVKNKIRVQDYFVGDFTLSDSTDLLYLSNLNSGNNTLSFANAIDYNSFYFSFKTKEEYANFNSLKVILTDPYDLSNKFICEIVDLSGITYFSINKGKLYQLQDDLGSDKLKSISYSNIKKGVSVSGYSSVINSEINFTSGLAYLDIQLNDINGNAGILVNEINNQNLYVGVVDRKPPTAQFDKTVGNYKIGGIVTINPANFYDVLSPINKNSMSLSVKLNDQPLTSIDGVVLDGENNDSNRAYQVELKEFGSYYVNFVCADGFGRKGEAVYILTVKDVTAPTITLNGKFKENCVVTMKEGQKLIVDYSVFDDISSKENLVVSLAVKNLRHNTIRIFKDNKFIATECGEHEISILCMDEAGNYSKVSFYITVKEGK